MNLKTATITVVRAILFIVLLMGASLCVIKGDAQGNTPVVSVGVVYDGKATLYDTHFHRLKNEIITLTTGEFDVRFDEKNIRDGMWDRARVKAEVASLARDPDVDLMLCLGVMSATEVSRYGQLPKPVVASSVFNALVSRTGSPERAAGVKNLNYILSTGNFGECLKLFHKVVPFRHLAIVVDRGVTEGIEGFEDAYKGTGRELDCDITFVRAESTSSKVLSSIPPESDGVVVAPLLSFSETEYAELVEGLQEKRLPSFTMLGKQDVGRGFLAGLSSGVESIKLLRRIALNVQRILLGDSPESLPTDFSEEETLVINMETARTIGVSPDWSVLSGAELINEDYSASSTAITLPEAIQEARRNNPDMEAGRRMVASGEQEVRKAMSYLAPRVDLSTTGIIIDENRAELSFGTESERQWNGAVSATQVLYSEKAWGGWASVKHTQEARVEEIESTRLDLSLDVARSFINVLRAKTLERIRKNNLALTQANLERARMRKTIGTAGASEVYRWESELARHRIDVIRSEVTVTQAKNALSRLLGKSQTLMIEPSEMTLSDAMLLTSDSRFIVALNTPRKFSVFQDFMVEEGVGASPELKRLSAAILASDRMTVSAERAYYLPDIVMQGDVLEVFDRSGFNQVADERDKTAWNVAVKASFPLFTGGGKTADHARARQEAERLRFKRQSVLNQMEERIRYSILQARASYAGISLSRDAAMAAGKNLTLVTDAYARGVLSIIDLLDAQNAAMMADLGAENAVYDYILDAMAAQRAIGRIDFSDSEVRNALYDRLMSYMETHTR